MFTRIKRFTLGAIALAAVAVGGAALGNAATPQSTATTTTSSPSIPAHGSATHEDAETAVTGDAAAKAKAAAVKSVGSGTAGDVTGDFRGGGYEVTVTKSDGSTVEVHLDSSSNVLQGGHGGFGGPEHGTAAHENAETAVTGDAATKAKAAAVKAAGSGTAADVTSDLRGGGYEVTVTKSDGSTVELHLDSSFNVLQGGPGH